MNILFQEKDPSKIIAEIKKVMGTRQLAQMVDFTLVDGDLLVTISKLGKSTLSFKRQETTNGCQFKLEKEKIALAHKPLKNDVKGKILKVIERAGGEILEA